MFTLIIISTPHLVCIAPFLTVADNGSTVLYPQAIKCVLACTVHVCNSRNVQCTMYAPRAVYYRIMPS